MNPQEYCQEKVAKSGSSFYYSFRLLEPDRRAAITALYAFCREVDDVVDECSEPQLARIKLGWWRTELDALYAGQPSHPVTRALAPAVQRYDLPREQLLEIIDGMEMDVDINRYATFKELSLYCYRVAGVVGLLAAQIFGYQDRATQKYAHDLGIAFQLTNIIRDVREDAERNRIYLPQEDLRRFHVDEEEILHFHETDKFRQLMAFQARRAEEYYDRALAQLPESDRYAQLPGLVMARIYRELLREIGADGWPVLHQRTSLTPLRKLMIAWRTAREERRRYKAWRRSGA